MGICKWICSKINKSIKCSSKSQVIHIIDAPTNSETSGLSHLSTVLPYESLLCHASQNYLNLINDIKVEGITADQLILPSCKEVVDYCMDPNIGLIYLLSDPTTLKWSNSKKLLNGAPLQSRITTDDQYISIQSTLEDHKYSLSNLRACSSSMQITKNLCEIISKIAHPVIKAVCLPYSQNFYSPTTKQYYFSKVYSKSMHSMIKGLPQSTFLYATIKVTDSWNMNNLYLFLKNSYLLYSLMWKWEGYADWIAIDDFISKYQGNLKQNPLMKETIESLPYSKQEICSLILSNQMASTEYLVNL